MLDPCFIGCQRVCVDATLDFEFQNHIEGQKNIANNLTTICVDKYILKVFLCCVSRCIFIYQTELTPTCIIAVINNILETKRTVTFKVFFIADMVIIM